MGCVASTQATSVTAQVSVTNTKNTGTIKTVAKQKTKMDDNQDMMEEFDMFYRTLDNPWLKLQDDNYVKKLCKTSIPSWSDVEDQKLIVRLV